MRATAGLILCVLLQLVIAGNNDDGKWKNLHAAGDIPSGRSSPTWVHIEGRNNGREFYLFGGQYDPDNGNFTNFNDLYRYNTHTNMWKKIEPTGPVPGPRVFHSGWQSSEESFTIIGGVSFTDAFFSNAVIYNDIWEYNIETNSWTQITDGTELLEPGLLSAAEVVRKGRYTYIFGGFNLATFSDINNLYRYDNHLKKLELVETSGPTPAPRHFTTMIDTDSNHKFIVSSGPLIFGGIDTTTYEFNTKNNKYHQINPSNAPSPSREFFYGATIDKKHFVAFGGDVPVGGAFTHNTVDETWELNINNKKWKQLFPAGETPPALKRHRIAEADGVIYMVAGFEGNESTGGAQIFNTDVWRYKRD